MKNLSSCVTFIFLANSIQMIYGLYENDYCTNPNQQNGICKKHEDCRNLQQLLRSGLKPTICGWAGNGRYPIICCPPDTVTTTEATTTTVSISSFDQNRGGSGENGQQSDQVKLVRKKCAEYGALVKEEIEDPALGNTGSTAIIDHCGRIAETMILGGIKANPREFPHMALIGYRDPPEYLCGGSLISERFILSAAHCSRPKRKGPARWAKLGELDTSSDFEEADPVAYRIIEILDHPDYDEATLYNDLTLFKLERNVILNSFIRPICLDTKSEVPPGFLTASGWGHTEWGGTASSNLMKVSLEHVSNEVCNFNYSKTIALGKQIPRGILSDSMICSGNVAGKDTCQGDSGGPLQANLTEPYCMYDLVGVTSFGRGCGLGYPGVYTRVSHYIPWIVQHVWPDNE